MWLCVNTEDVRRGNGHDPPYYMPRATRGQGNDEADCTANILEYDSYHPPCKRCLV